jgi:transposase
MDNELTALAASGATTLVSLMATDSWTHARELLRRFLTRSDPRDASVTDLDTARARLLTSVSTSDPHVVRAAIDHWDAYLRQLLEARAVSGDDLRELLASLQRLQSEASRPGTVRNNINGGVQRGPVIQSGQITGLTLHAHHPNSQD